MDTHTHLQDISCQHACTDGHTWVTGRAVVSHEAGQARHRLRGEVPDCVKHICGMDPVVIWIREDNKSAQCVCDRLHQGAVLGC